VAEQVKDFVDVLLQLTAESNHTEGETKAARETIKAMIFVCFHTIVNLFFIYRGKIYQNLDVKLAVE